MGNDAEKRLIAERVSILDLVSPYVQLKKAGKYYRGLCPFHPDRNPSFVVNPDRNAFYCFGCGAGGDIYSFFMRFHNVPFPQALEELARRAGIELRTGRGRRRKPAEEEKYGKALALNEWVCQAYHRALLEAPEARAARGYLQDRAVSKDLVTAFSLGYAREGWDRLVTLLGNRTDALELAAELGLLVPKRGGKGYYDRFRDRLMFPIFNATGKVVGFGGRSLGGQEPKYLNSPDSFVYHKGHVLYGLHRAQEAIREQDEVLVVEGYFDLLALHGHGIHNAVAVLGTSLTTDQIDILKRYTRNLLLVFDGDPAGRKASFRNLPEFLDRDIPARVAYLPEGEDPDSFLRRRGREAFKRLLEQASPLLDLFIRERLGGLRRTDPVEQKMAVLRELLPMIRRIPSRLEQNLRIHSVAEEIGIPELFLRDELSNQGRVTRPRRGSPSGAVLSAGVAKWPAEERLICQILVQYPSLLPAFREAKVLDAFRSDVLREVIRAIAQQYEERGSLDLSVVLPEGEDRQVARWLAGLACKEDLTREQASRALEDSVRHLRKRTLKERLNSLNRMIQEAERSHQIELRSQLSVEKQRLLEEKKALLY